MLVDGAFELSMICDSRQRSTRTDMARQFAAQGAYFGRGTKDGSQDDREACRLRRGGEPLTSRCADCLSDLKRRHSQALTASTPSGTARAVFVQARRPCDTAPSTMFRMVPLPRFAEEEHLQVPPPLAGEVASAASRRGCGREDPTSLDKALSSRELRWSVSGLANRRLEATSSRRSTSGRRAPR